MRHNHSARHLIELPLGALLLFSSATTTVTPHKNKQHVVAPQQKGRNEGAIDPATAATLSTAVLHGSISPLDALTQALGMGAAAAAGPVLPGTLSHDFEFSAVELVKPTRMNRVYLVFACSILEQDLMFVVYNIPTVGICRWVGVCAGCVWWWCLVVVGCEDGCTTDTTAGNV